MSSPTRNTRGGTTSFDFRTLLIASVSSAVAAIVVSRFWASGTPVAAAATPVIVTFLREALDRPTAAVAARMTAETRALPDTDVREPVPARVADRMRGTGQAGRPVPPGERERGARPGGGNGRDQDDIRIYRTQPTSRSFGRINPKVVLVTGLLAFLIAGLVITAGQVLAGHPFGKEGHGAIILGQHKKRASSNDSQQNTTTEQQQTTTTPSQQPTTTTPDQQQTTPTPTTPQQTTPQPAPRNQTQTTPGGTPAQP